MFSSQYGQRGGLAIETYSALNWAIIDFKMRRHAERKKTIEVEKKWLVPPGFDLVSWIQTQPFDCYSFLEIDNVIIEAADGIIDLKPANNKIGVTLIGSPEFCAQAEQLFDSQFSRAEHTVRWIYNSHGSDVEVPINHRPLIQAAFPWLNQPVQQYIQSYLEAAACVIILIGPPGTGKTTFIKNIIRQSRKKARIAYDHEVLNGDGFFATFIDGDDDILVMEDSDAFLSSRQDGNTLMHKFLNVSDGLISSLGKKIIFSTNLPNISDIDPALVRAGRCFDVMRFRPLTRKEAEAVLAEAGITRPLPDGTEFRLAELFSQPPSSHGGHKNKIGFIS